MQQLPNQLGDIVNVTDATTRRNLQNSVVRYGVLIQYLGSLLLELGRTTMMLRINPATVGFSDSFFFYLVSHWNDSVLLY